MVDFEERLKKAMEVAQRQQPAAGARGGELVAVLEKFAHALDSNPNLLVHAVVEKGPHPQVWSIVTSPRYRRDQRSYMLRFWQEGQRLKAMNDWGDAPLFGTTEEIENHLLKFFEDPAFQSTLASYAQICAEDIDAFLRTGGLDTIGPKDVLVLVRAPDQKRLAEATQDTKLEMGVLLDEGLGAYEPGAHYVLASGGFGMQIDTHEKTPDGQIELVGTVLAPLHR
jgi:hypothetical protein